MLQILLYSIICFMAIYGFCEIISRLLKNFIADSTKTLKSPYTVLCVKNQADSIEATIRSIAWRLMSQNHSRELNDIVVVDLGSTDDTFEILTRLAREYIFLHPMSKERYLELVGSM